MDNEPNNKEYAFLGFLGLCYYGSYVVLPFVYILFLLEWFWFNILLWPLIKFGKWYVKKKDKEEWHNET